MKIIKEKVWLVPCPGVGIRAVTIEYWWKRIMIARKLIYRDLDNICRACYFNSNEEILFRGNL